MRYKFQEFVKKQEERFTKKEVNNSSLIRISDANHYFEMYVKSLLPVVGKSFCDYCGEELKEEKTVWVCQYCRDGMI